MSSPRASMTEPFQVFESITWNPITNKKTRNMSPGAKAHAARVRKQPGGACPLHKHSKRKVKNENFVSERVLTDGLKCIHIPKEDEEKSFLDPKSADKTAK